MGERAEQDSALQNDEWWRAVLGEYPTGIALVTATVADGLPAGMIVGSFVAISQDPPLIGFLGDDASSTYRSIAGVDRFAVSVLGEAHDGLLRAFIRKDADRYTSHGLIEGANGALRHPEAVAWFEARTVSVQRLGDHEFVVGEVTDFGVGPDSGSPLLYRRGGFGAFSIPADALDARLIGARLAAAQAATEVLAPLARRIDREVAVTTVVGESVVILTMVTSVPSTFNPEADDPAESVPEHAIGVSLPFAAPVEPLFAAWAPERVRSLWIERARHLVGRVNRRRVEAQLAAIRERGYGVSVDMELNARFFSLIADHDAERGSYAKLWSQYAARTIESATADLPLGDIAAIQVPVFDVTGQVALVLTVSDLEFPDRESLDAFAADLVEAAARVSGLLGRQPRGRSLPPPPRTGS